MRLQPFPRSPLDPASQIGSGHQPLFEGLRSRCQRPGGGKIGLKRRQVGEPLEHRSLVGVATKHFDRQRLVSCGDVVAVLVGLGDLLAGQLVASDFYRPSGDAVGSSAAAAATAPTSSAAIICRGIPGGRGMCTTRVPSSMVGVMNCAKLSMKNTGRTKVAD